MENSGAIYTPTGFKTRYEESYIPAKHLVDDSSSGHTFIKEDTTFLTKGLDEFYVPIDKCEGRHRFDPKFRWEEDEKKKLVRKVRGDAGSQICRIMLMLLLRSTCAFVLGCA